jgi:hypothetical protein
MSEVKVNKISPRTNCGTVTVGDSGDSVSVTAGVPVTVNGDLKSNALKATDGGSIISQSGTTITLGASGDTINLASGASQSGFGRTGTVDWQTGDIKTATFTAANGEGYFANTSGGAFTMNLPAGSAGNIVSVVDYTNTFQTNNLTVAANGSQKIGGVQATVALNTEGQSVTFVYVDDTEGWKNVQDSTSNATGRGFISATGGTITTSGNCKIHTFTGPGTFCVSSISSEAPENVVSYLVVAGGGNGGSIDNNNGGGAGGGGGFREVKTPLTPYTASPLDGYPSSPNRVTITASPFPITVGGGGTNNSIFSTITSAGGGGQSGNGGSGGGGSPVTSAGSGNTPPTSPPQGNNGGAGGPVSPPFPQRSGGGGGGSGGTGGAGSAGTGGTPGPSVSTSITGSSTAYAKGGQGANGNTSSGPDIGAVNTGNGNGGKANPTVSRNGSSGIVIIRYKYQ